MDFFSSQNKIVPYTENSYFMFYELGLTYSIYKIETIKIYYISGRKAFDHFFFLLFLAKS